MPWTPFSLAGSPKLFDPKTLLPIDFDDTTAGVQSIDLYLETEDGGIIEHLLLTGAAAYIEQGYGIPPGLSSDQKKIWLLISGSL